MDDTRSQCGGLFRYPLQGGGWGYGSDADDICDAPTPESADKPTGDTPTPQAMKAAEIVWRRAWSISHMPAEDIARIIDEATGLPGLVALCERFLASHQRDAEANGCRSCPCDICPAARAALKGNPT